MLEPPEASPRRLRPRHLRPRHLRPRDLRPKGLILDLLSTVPKGDVPVAGLLAAAEPFEIPANRVRVALARLVKSGLVESPKRGLYRLGSSATAVNQRVTEWRRGGEASVRWHGRWIGVHTAGLPRSDRSALATRTRALEFLGFAELDPGLSVRPENLRGGTAGVRERLFTLGLDPRATVFELGDLDDETERRARRLWDTAALQARYRELRSALEQSTERLPTLPRTEAMRESFLLGGEAIRALALDPNLPEALVPSAERLALRNEMKRYDRIGRACWRGVLVPTGLAHGPADQRVLETVHV